MWRYSGKGTSQAQKGGEEVYKPPLPPRQCCHGWDAHFHTEAMVWLKRLK